MKHLQELVRNEKRWKNYQKLNIKVTNIGSCEWYIDAIISYISIHYGILNSEINFSKQQLKNKISDYRNSKNLPDLNYFEISSTIYQKAHIKGVSLIQKEKFEELNKLCNLHFFKNKLSEEKYTEKKNEIFDSTKKEIMSKDNLLKMSPNMHVLFDNDYFTYSSENGNIIWNKNKLNKLTNADKEIILKEYSKINDLEHRKKFLISRNSNLKNFIS